MPMELRQSVIATRLQQLPFARPNVQSKRAVLAFKQECQGLVGAAYIPLRLAVCMLLIMVARGRMLDLLITSRLRIRLATLVICAE